MINKKIELYSIACKFLNVKDAKNIIQYNLKQRSFYIFEFALNYICKINNNIKIIKQHR